MARRGLAICGDDYRRSRRLTTGGGRGGGDPDREGAEHQPGAEEHQADDHAECDRLAEQCSHPHLRQPSLHPPARPGRESYCTLTFSHSTHTWRTGSRGPGVSTPKIHERAGCRAGAWHRAHALAPAASCHWPAVFRPSAARSIARGCYRMVRAGLRRVASSPGPGATVHPAGGPLARRARGSPGTTGRSAPQAATGPAGDLWRRGRGGSGRREGSAAPAAAAGRPAPAAPSSR